MRRSHSPLSITISILQYLPYKKYIGTMVGNKKTLEKDFKFVALILKE